MFSLSVVIPAYKSEATIARTLRSVLAQESVALEVIVVEDGVFDQTSAVVSRFPDVKLVSFEDNKGVCAARNEGLRSSTKDTVLFLDSDDVVEGNFFFSILETMTTSEADVVFAPWRFGGDCKDRPRQRFIAETSNSDEFLIAWLECEHWAWAWPGRIAWRRSALLAQGGWNEAMFKRDDDEIMVRALINRLKITASFSGSGVYWMHDSENRRSGFADIHPTTNKCEQHIVDSIASYFYNDAGARNRKRGLVALGKHCYRLAYRDYCHRSDQSASRWIQQSREFGFDGHLGTATHCLISRLLGLHRKTLLSRSIHRSLDAVKSIGRRLATNDFAA